MLYIVLVTGLYLFGLGIMMETKNLISTVLFKLIPTALGMLTVIQSLKMLEIL